MTLISPKRKTALNSDALTGEWLVPGSPRFVVHPQDTDKRVVERVHYYRARQTRTEPTGDVVSAPIALHRHETDAGGLGGLVYTVMMLQYLRYASDAQTRAEQLALIAWWRSDYGRQRVLRGVYDRMAQRFPREQAAKEAERVLEVVLACHEEAADPAVIAERYGRSEAWVRGNVDWCMRIAVRHRQSCQCETCRRRE